MLGTPSLKVLSIKLFASLGIQGDLLHQRGLHRLQVGIVVSMTQGGNGGDGDRSNLTTPPPLTGSIGEKGGRAIGALKKRCGKRKTRRQKNAAKQHLPMNEKKHNMTCQDIRIENSHKRKQIMNGALVLPVYVAAF